MASFLIKRIIQLLVVFFIITMVAYLLLFVIGNPVYVMFGGGVAVTQAQIDELTQQMGLDQPIFVQYARFLYRVVTQGDFGKSYYYKQPAMGLILERIPATLALAVPSLLLSAILSIPFGIIAAIRRGTVFDRAILGFSMLGTSTPSFWMSLILVYVFAVELKVLPSSGYGTPAHVILPMVGVTFSTTATLVRMVRSETLEVLRKDYVRTAYAKGLSSVVVLGRHVLRNALIPFVTYFGMLVGNVLGMTIITEKIFAWPGSGRLLLTSIERMDQPLVVSYVVVIACLFVFVNLIVDFSYIIIDPRITFN